MAILYKGHEMETHPYGTRRKIAEICAVNNKASAREFDLRQALEREEDAVTALRKVVATLREKTKRLKKKLKRVKRLERARRCISRIQNGIPIVGTHFWED